MPSAEVWGNCRRSTQKNSDPSFTSDGTLYPAISHVAATFSQSNGGACGES